MLLKFSCIPIEINLLVMSSLSTIKLNDQINY